MVLFGEDHLGPRTSDFKIQDQAYYRVYIRGARHSNFTDKSLGLLGPAGGMLLGPIDGRRMQMILSLYLVAFFDKHLQGVDSPLLDGPDRDLPEVDFHSR